MQAVHVCDIMHADVFGTGVPNDDVLDIAVMQDPQVRVWAASTEPSTSIVCTMDELGAVLGRHLHCISRAHTRGLHGLGRQLQLGMLH